MTFDVGDTISTQIDILSADEEEYKV